MAKVHVKKGDLVQVLWGVDKGRTGRVLEVRPRESRVIVDNINIIKRHTRPTRQNPQGGVVEQPGPIHTSKVALVCPSCDKPTRAKRERSEEGALRRVCRRCGKSID